MDRPGVCPQEAETVLQTPDAGAGERVPLQRLRVEAEAVGAGEESDAHRAAGEDLVSEPTDEEQEEHPATSGAGEQQQHQQHKQQHPPSSSPPPRVEWDQAPPPVTAGGPSSAWSSVWLSRCHPGAAQSSGASLVTPSPSSPDPTSFKARVSGHLIYIRLSTSSVS